MKIFKIKRQCPFCKELQFKVERFDNGLYLLSCLNSNTSASMWTERYDVPMFRKVKVTNSRTPKRMSSYDRQEFNKLQVPYWKMMGLKPKAKDIAYEKELAWRGMTYGDAVLERSMHAENKSGLSEWENHMNKYGRNNAPKAEHQKS